MLAGWANRHPLFSKPCQLNLKLGEAAVAGGPTSPAQFKSPVQGGGSASKHWPLGQTALRWRTVRHGGVSVTAAGTLTKIRACGWFDARQVQFVVY